MKTHDDASPSGAKRWIVCVGSVWFCKGAPDESSEASERGTGAHEMLETCIKSGRAPQAFVKRKFNGFSGEELVEGVDKGVDYILKFKTKGSSIYSEKRVHTRYMRGGGGTLDVAIVDGQTLHVFDYKNGRRLVRAEMNEQMMLYALGKLEEYDDCDFTQVVLHIVQPHANPDVGEAWVTTPAFLHRWGRTKVLPAIDKILAGDRTLTAGPHCENCRRRGSCPAAAKAALGAAQMDWKEPGPGVVPHGPKELAAMFKTLPFLESWMKAVRAEIMLALARGDKVGDLKLVCPRPSRKWVNEAQVMQAFSRLGIKADDFAPRSLVGIGEGEKLVPKAKRATFMKTFARLSINNTPVLAAADDKRPPFRGDPKLDFEDDLHED